MHSIPVRYCSSFKVIGLEMRTFLPYNSSLNLLIVSTKHMLSLKSSRTFILVSGKKFDPNQAILSGLFK